MRPLLSISIALTITACDRRGDSPPASPPPAPNHATPGVTPSSPPVSGPDIVVLPDKTSTGGEVLEIGKPRLRLTPDLALELEVRLGAKRAFAVDRDEVKIWELDGGTLVQRHEPQWNENTAVTLKVSPDGRWLATGRVLDTTVLREPFASVAFRVHTRPSHFTASSARLVGTDGTPTIVDLAQQKVVAQAPSPAASSIMNFAVAEHGRYVYWIRNLDLLRWEPATNKLEVIATATPRWKHAAIAARAPIAIAITEDAMYRLDLERGTTTQISKETGPGFAISPSGDRVAMALSHEIRVLDTNGGKQLASVKTSSVARRLTFTDDDNTLAYVDDQTIRIHDLTKGPRRFPEPSRFRGWLSGDVAAIARGTTTQQLPIKTHVPATVDVATIAALEPKPPQGAPAWATWISAMPNGDTIAAEASPRHALPTWRRWEEACAEKLRVWTAKGGERTFSLVPTEADGLSSVDPCWEITGGYVIAATMSRIEVYDPVTGKRIAKLDPGQPPEPTKDRSLAHQYWSVTASPTGTHLALVWRRADVWAPPQAQDPRSHGDLGGGQPPQCESDRNLECKKEYVAEVWSLTGNPKRLWKSRLDSKHPTSRTWPLPKIASGPITFTHDGKHVLFGFDDGDILIRAVDAEKSIRVESLHRAPIARIELSPSDGYVFSEDTAGEQRIWPLARP